MHRSQQILLNVLALLSLLGMFFFVSANFFQPVDYELLNVDMAQAPLGQSLLIVAALTALAVAFKMYERLITQRHQSTRAERQREKAEVTAETSAEKVRALEAKVQTLEKALEDALSRQAH